MDEAEKGRYVQVFICNVLFYKEVDMMGTSLCITHLITYVSEK